MGAVRMLVEAGAAVNQAAVRKHVAGSMWAISPQCKPVCRGACVFTRVFGWGRLAQDKVVIHQRDTPAIRAIIRRRMTLYDVVDGQPCMHVVAKHFERRVCFVRVRVHLHAVCVCEQKNGVSPLLIACEGHFGPPQRSKLVKSILCAMTTKNGQVSSPFRKAL